MAVTDPIADYLTRLRNAAAAHHKSVQVPASKILTEISRILKEYGYIKDYQVIEDGKQGILEIQLRYSHGRPAFHELKRVSKPGRRIYRGVKEIPRVKSGLGIAILSTPKGVMTDKEARRFNVGGEVLCTVW